MNSQDLARMVSREIDFIMRGVMPLAITPNLLDNPPALEKVKTLCVARTVEEASRFLRIEVSEQQMAYLGHTDMPFQYCGYDPRYRWPQSFMGVSLYVVERELPPHGWQIINPFRRGNRGSAR